MTRPSFIQLRFSMALPLLAVLTGCAAFNAGPQSEAARAANAANPGYPRLVDVPAAPANPPTAAQHQAEADALVAQRESLSDMAEELRAQRPAGASAAERVTLPDDMPPGPATRDRGEGAQ